MHTVAMLPEENGEFCRVGRCPDGDDRGATFRGRHGGQPAQPLRLWGRGHSLRRSDAGTHRDGQLRRASYGHHDVEEIVMAYYAGIDLGTTNSAIATWDGSTLKLWKSPEQNDVTPSAIYFDRRGRYVGKRAYDLAPKDRTTSAPLLKRPKGTSPPEQKRDSMT